MHNETAVPNIHGDDSSDGVVPQAPLQSPLYQAFLREQRRERRRVLLWQAALLIGFLACWEIAPRQHWINPMLTSYPSAIASTFITMLREGQIIHHTLITLLETLVSFFASMILGTLGAIAFWWWPISHRVLDPYFVVVNALPKIALVPIFYLWLGPQLSIYGMAIAVSVFITVLMIHSGFMQADANKIKLVRSFGASRLQILRKVVLPSSVPSFIAAMKVNVGLALVGVIVGEFQSIKYGLGFLILYGSQIFKMDMVMVAIAILGLMSFAMYLAIQMLETRILKSK
jgi:NitT/TauT family transport system permease protein